MFSTLPQTSSPSSFLTARKHRHTNTCAQPHAHTRRETCTGELLISHEWLTDWYQPGAALTCRNAASAVGCWDTTGAKKRAFKWGPSKAVKAMERDIISAARSRKWVPHSGAHVIRLYACSTHLLRRKKSALSFQKVTDSRSLVHK